MDNKSLKNMESAVIITRNVDGIIKVQKGQTSIIILDRKQNQMDSVHTINSSYISYRNPKSLKRSFSEEDLNLYESCIANENKEIQKEESNYESQRVSDRNLRENLEERNTLQEMLLSQKGLMQSRLSRIGMKTSQNISETGLRQTEKSIKVPIDMEETIQNLMQHLDENFESFDQSEIIPRDFIETQEQEREPKVEEIVEDNQIGSSQVQSQSVESEGQSIENKETESVKSNKESEKVQDITKTVEVKTKKTFGVNTIFLLLSIMFNLALFGLVLRHRLEPIKVKEVVVEKQVLVPQIVERQMEHVISAADVYVSREYRLLFNEKDDLYKENILNRKKIDALEAEINRLGEEKNENKRVIAGLTEDKHKFQERFKELEVNLNRTIDIISQLKKHLPGTLGETITTNFKQLVNIVGKIL